MAIRITVQSNRFPAIGAALQGRVETVVKKTALDLESYAKSVAPVDTGNLKASIATEVNGTSATVNVGAEYGIYVEYGTYKMRAQPFMTPAAEHVRPAFNAALRQIFEGR